MLRVHLYHMQGSERQLVSMRLTGNREGEPLLSLRNKLESTQYFSSSFRFWDSRLSSHVHIKLEGLIFIEDLEGKLVVFETKDYNVIVESVPESIVVPHTAIDANKDLPLICDVPIEYTEPKEFAVNSSVASSEPSVAGEDTLEGKALFLSKKMFVTAEKTWKDQKVNEDEKGEKKPLVVEGLTRRRLLSD
ncbi:hypothetical protein R1sor_017031 [Riccia sorocarpa]|uniref:Uncharacterized protein n=1 Tax=Riccia sorocarpa TaxID=122646 RepID=A0ABD3I7I1_9MARC